jgi:tetratricopeptide (TPR) repeat protein
MRLVTLAFAATLVVASTGRVVRAQVAADTNSYDWLIKAAHEAVDRGEAATNEEQRTTLYKNAEQYARRAVAANPNDAEGHFQLARAIGRNALTMGTRDRIKFAGVVRDEAITALKLNPNHDGAMHIMGVWNAEVMRLNGFSRMIAKNFLGGKVFNAASWDSASFYLEKAVQTAPNRITHHLDLAAVYVDRDQKEKAKEQYEWIARATPTEYNDGRYKEEAARRLKELR